MRGRKPKTTEEKRAAGKPGHRALPKNRPETPEGSLWCPSYFTADEKLIWRQTLRAAPKGIIRPADAQLLITFVEQVVMRIQAMRELRKMAEDRRKDDGTTECMTVQTERGWVKNPLITVADSCAKNIRSLASELGLSPASRERLGNKEPKGKSLREMLTDQKDTPECLTSARPN